MPVGGATPVYQGQIDVPLSNFARQYTNNNLVSPFVAPPVSAAAQSGLYWTFGRDDQFLPPDGTLRAPGARPHQVRRTLSTSNFFARGYSLERQITAEEMKVWGVNNLGDARMDAVTQVTRLLQLDAEKKAATLLTTAANYASANKVTLAGSNQWDNAASTPINDVENAKLQISLIGQQATALILTPYVLKALKSNPQVIARFVNVKGGPVTNDQLASILGIDQILVASAVQVDASNTPSFLWGKFAWIGYVNPAAKWGDLSFAKRFVCSMEDVAPVDGWGVQVVPDAPATKQAELVAVHTYYDMKITGADAGYLISAAVS